jgi:hypothetical protein
VEPERQGDEHAEPHLHVTRAQQPVEPASVTLPVQPYVGGHGRVPSVVDVAPLASFADVQARARRLVEWAQEESEYLRTHDVGLFSPADVEGRTGFADEGLYELLPALQADAARLRAACGRGPLWTATRALCDQAAEAVQTYYLLWQRLRQANGR